MRMHSYESPALFVKRVGGGSAYGMTSPRKNDFFRGLTPLS